MNSFQTELQNKPEWFHETCSPEFGIFCNTAHAFPTLCYFHFAGKLSQERQKDMGRDFSPHLDPRTLPCQPLWLRPSLNGVGVASFGPVQCR